MLKNFKNKIILFFISLIVLIPYYFSLDPNKIYIGADTIIPLNPQWNFFKYFYTWLEINGGTESLSFLHPWTGFYYILSFITDLHFSQLLWILIINFLAFIGVYKLAQFVFNDHKYKLFISILTGVIYLYHPFHMNLMVGHPPLFVYPWIIYLFLKYINQEKIITKYIIYINLIIIFGTLSDFPNPKYFLLSFLIMALFSVFWGLLEKKWWKTFYKLVILGLSSFLLNAFILFPYVYSLLIKGAGYGIEAKASIMNTQGTFLDEGSSTVLNMLRLHHNGLTINLEFRPFYSSNVFIIVIPYIFFAFLLILFIFKRQEIYKNKNFFLLFSSLIVLLLLPIGPNPPFGDIYKWFVKNIVIFISFRTTAGLLLPVAVIFSVLLAYFVIWIFSLIKERKNFLKFLSYIWIIVFLAMFFTISYPMFLGYRFLNFNGINSSPELEGHKGLVIPVEYYQANYFLQKKSLEGFDLKKVLLIPPKDYESTDWGYFGIAMMPFIVESQIINGLSNGYTYNNPVLIKNIYQDLSNLDLSPFLENTRLIGVDYVIYQKDHIANDYDNKKKDLRILLSSSLIYQNNKVDIYDLTKYRKPALDDIYVLINNRELVEQNIDWFEVKKINPTKYLLKIKEPIPNFTLVLNQTFDDKWKINKVKGLTINNHRIINNFANAWEINMSNDIRYPIVLEIRYFPQDLFNYGVMVSIITLLLLIGGPFILKYIIFKRKKTIFKFKR